MNGNDYWEVVLVIRWHLTEYSFGTPVPKYLRYEKKKQKKINSRVFLRCLRFSYSGIKFYSGTFCSGWAGLRIVEVEIQTIKNRGMILCAYYFKIFLVE